MQQGGKRKEKMGLMMTHLKNCKNPTEECPFVFREFE